MMQPWLAGRMAEEHRRDLTPSGRVRAPWGGQHAAGHSAAPAALAASRPVRLVETPQVLMRRPIGHQVGTLLIRAGTRLGGASIRTS